MSFGRSGLTEWRSAYLVSSEPARSTDVLYAGLTRNYVLSPAMVAGLALQRARAAAGRLRDRNLWIDSGFVFTTYLRDPADPPTCCGRWRSSSAESGLGEIAVHTHRHIYATVAVLNHGPVHVVSRDLAHCSIAVTADIYGHLTDEASPAAAVSVSGASPVT